MSKFFKLLFIIFIVTFFTGCNNMKIEDFKNTTPEFIPQDYFNGKIKAYGLVKDRSGNIIRTFKADLIGSWDENGVGTLREYFVFNDGEKQQRVWTLKPIENKEGEFIGTANDVVGKAYMKALGNSVVIDYTLEIDYKGTKVNINVKDWLHLQEDGVIINHSKMKKFGLVVGELVITMIKE
ncbi:MAG: DUF3833 domain-containing protein [Campylobacterota bacterium]